ncbi:MAG: DUF1634 domain-containing protein [Acidobacteriota bacterium]
MANNTQLERLEDLLGRVLVGGVVASATILAIGLIVDLTPYNAHPVLQLGLILLMATPILRVAVSLVEYIRMRDWFFSATTGAVLVVLLTSIVLALSR